MGLLGSAGQRMTQMSRKIKEPLLCAFSFCSAFSELSQPWAVLTGSWHLTWEAFLFSTGLFKI